MAFVWDNENELLLKAKCLAEQRQVQLSSYPHLGRYFVPDEILAAAKAEIEQTRKIHELCRDSGDRNLARNKVRHEVQEILKQWRQSPPIQS